MNRLSTVTPPETKIGTKSRWYVLASIISSRTVYSLNWYNFSPALVEIGSDLRIDSFGIALITASFLLGAGLFQVPAGFIAAHWGNKNTSQLGMLILSLSAISEGLSPSFASLFASRLILGIGASLFFSPAIGVLTPLFREEEEGLVIGLYNGAFSVGGGVGIWIWALIIQAYHWRVGLVLGGLIGLVLFAIGQLVVPRDKASHPTYKSVKQVLRSRNIWIIAIGVLGLWGGIFTSSQFLLKYLTEDRGVSFDTAGLMASLLLFASIIGGPLGGYLSDKLRTRKQFILIPGVASSILIPFIGIVPVIGLWLLIPALGFLYAMVFSTMYASPSQYPEIGKRYAPLGISLMNSVHILGAFGIPVGYYFAILATGNASAGWYFMGVLALALMTIVTLLQEPFKQKSVNENKDAEVMLTRS